LGNVSSIAQSISKVSAGSPNAALISSATSGLAINIEVPESTIAESKATEVEVPAMVHEVNLRTHQA